ncbi:MAG: ATP-binding protein [Bacteroidota bacterium]
MPSLHVRGLDRFVDDVHAQFDAWAAVDTFRTAIGDDGLAVLRLAAHEWVANLVQHAEFCGPAELALSLEIVDDGLRCQIEDSSRGFDFVRQLDAQRSIFETPAPSERGRGLLMLVSCTEDLAFREVSETDPQQIAFTVRAPEDDNLFASLFRPEDIMLDAAPEDLPLPVGEEQGDGASDAVAPIEVRPDPLSS